MIEVNILTMDEGGLPERKRKNAFTIHRVYRMPRAFNDRLKYTSTCSSNFNLRKALKFGTGNGVSFGKNWVSGKEKIPLLNDVY